MTDPRRPPTTTDSGIPAASDEHSLTVGPAGPIVLHDHYWTRVDEQIGARVAAGLGHGNGSSPNGELREAQELIDARAGTA
jgi:catalase